MSLQQSLFAPPTTATPPPDEGYTRYEIEVDGVKMFADFHPSYFKSESLDFNTMHVAFYSKSAGVPNPLSETGYRSHFMLGSCEGMGDDEIVRSIRELAEAILKGE